jgi:hypothetical protein
LRAVGHAHATAHAGGGVDAGETVIYGNGSKLANVGALAAGSTQIGITCATYPGEAIIGVPFRCASIAPQQHEQQLQMA